jgi:CelD/BcsL family acetyltransferase involved in cellulose biosynthesis
VREPRVHRVDPRIDPLWRELAELPGGSLFTSPPWLTAITAAYGFEPAARVAVDAVGRPRSGLAWVDVDDLRGQRRLALPFCDRADPIIAAPETADASWAELTDEACAGDLPFTLRCLDTSPAVEDPRLRTVGQAAWHVTSLNRPLDGLHAALRPHTRRNIAKAERAGLEVILSPEAEAVAEYHRLHVELRRRKYRLLAQPLTFFQAVWRAFAPADGIRTALAFLHGRPVAGAVYLVWNDTVYYKFGASQAEHLSARPNDAIHWTLIRWAHDRGLKALDWGLSDLDQPGLCAYKSNWASTEGRIRTLNLGGSPIGRSEHVEHMLGSLTNLLTDPSVPHQVTAEAGSVLYRFFC